MAHRRSREQWRQLVGGWPRSGLTQREYCARHGASVASLRRWREMLSEPRQSVDTGSKNDAVHLLPVHVVEHGGGAGALTLVLADGLRIEVGCGFDGPTFQRLLDLLRESA